MKIKYMFIVSTLLLSSCSAVDNKIEPFAHSDVNSDETNNSSTINESPNKETNTDTTTDKNITIEDIFDPLILVNKENSIGSDFVPNDLQIPNIPLLSQGDIEKNYVSAKIIPDLEQLVADAKNEGLNLYLVSGYRSYSRQVELYDSYINQYGTDHTELYSAKPGHSEHQTGLSLDVSSPSANNNLEEVFAYTNEGIWLAENAHKYGFIIRYPKGKEEITQYAYEPWHIRFVGKEAASEIYRKNLTLEEFLEIHE